MESTPVNILNDLAIPQWVLTFFAFYGLGILLVVWGAVMDLLDTDELTPPKELVDCFLIAGVSAGGLQHVSVGRFLLLVVYFHCLVGLRCVHRHSLRSIWQLQP